MQETTYDAIVIGAGPAGSTTATLLAQNGRRVLQLERETFPRFKIGESLIPATHDTLKRLGLLERMRESAFTKKYSVQFFTGDGKPSRPFYFHETDPSERSQTWQVVRSELDQLLLEHGREHGVEAIEGAAVQEVLFDGERAIGVRYRGPDGEMRDVHGRVVVDASGQRAVLARQLKLRRPDSCLKMAAIFTHFENAHRDPGIDEGATLVLQTAEKNSWFWYIPLHDNRVSVGVVGPISYLIQGRQGDPQQVFDEEVAICPGLAPRLENARQMMDARVLNDFSYSAERIAGDGWVLAGDAFTFLDPVYSSGVLLAFKSGELAADAILDGLEHGDLSAERLRRYETRMKAGIDGFRRLVYTFYTKEFSFGGFLRAHPEHRRAIVDILVGDVFERDFEPLFGDVQAFLGQPEKTADMETSVA